MPTDTDNNFLVTGASGNAVIATDYSAAESSHFQVVKVAWGNTLDNNRVTDSQGLPVEILNQPTVTVSSVSGSVAVSGSVGVYGIAGVTAIGVTASDLDIRNLTAGTVTTGDPSTSTVDIVRVIGYSGGYPVGVTASDLDIRNLTAGTVTVGDPSTSTVDIVRVIGYSGGYPIGITATDLDIRSLTSSSDSVRVLGGVTVSNGEGNPFEASLIAGFQTRLLRATKSADAATNYAILAATIGSDGILEDTVRVVGLSGAYPVDVALMGFTNISNRATRLPLNVDSTGALYVNLASGSINVTANVTTTDFTLSGVSLADASAAKETIQIRGYTGPGAVAIGVTATDLDIRNLSSTTDSVYAQVRLLGASGSDFDKVDLGGTAALVTDRFYSALNRNDDGGFFQLKTDDVSTATILTEITTEGTGIKALAAKIDTALNQTYKASAAESSNQALRVFVAGVAQPSGATSGRITVSASAVQMANNPLNSGIHFKSDLGNSNSTIFVGTNNTAQIGYPLYNGDQVFIETDNTNKIWLSATAGATVYFIGT